MSRWLDVGRVLLFAFLKAKTKLKIKEMQKKKKKTENKAYIQQSWLNKLVN